MKTKPRTKGVIIGFSNGKSDDDEQSTDEEMEGENEDDSDSIGDIKPKSKDMEMEIEEFTLPGTIEGVRDRFNQLYVEFMRHNKHEHTNELMFLLDEMLRQGAITPTEYAQLNTSITEAADLRTDGAEKEQDSDDEEEQNLMKSAVDYIIQHDKEELLQLMEELKDDIDKEFMNIVLDIETLLEIFFEEEFLDGESIRPQIDELFEVKVLEFMISCICKVLNVVNCVKYCKQYKLLEFMISCICKVLNVVNCVKYCKQYKLLEFMISCICKVLNVVNCVKYCKQYHVEEDDKLYLQGSKRSKLCQIL